MANSHITAAWERAPLAKGNDLLVLLSLADQANDDGWCWPGQGSLVRRTKTSRATVQRALVALSGFDYIEIHERPGTSNLYRVTIDGVPQIEAPPSPEVASPDEAPPASSTVGVASPDEAPGASPGEARTPIEPPLGDPPLNRETALAEMTGCATVGCDKPAGHRGAHRDPWWDAIVFSLGYEAPAHQASRFGKLARRAQDVGITPEQIIQAAATIADAWGLEAVTLNALHEHLEWALSPLRSLSSTDLADFRQTRERAARKTRMGLATGTDGVLRLAGPERESIP